jgi:hypothetical protein
MPKIKPGTTITGCTFVGAQWDATSVAAIQTLADALKANAQACYELAQVFSEQHIQIDAMLKVER